MIKINISDIVISFPEIDNKIKEYIIKEFNTLYLKTNQNDLKSDIAIKIFCKRKFDFVVKKKINANVYIDESGNVMQVIRAKARKMYVVYSKHFNKINIFIPYKTTTSIIQKMFDPKYLNKWQNCLVDFFQGPFIGIIEYFLLRNGHTFIHGSSFCYENEGYVFCGKAQVGKTEIAKALQDNAQILADDLTILCNKGYICTYQKSIGVFLKNININNYFKNSKKLDIILEKINFYIFSKLRFLKLRSKRIIFFRDLFKNAYNKNTAKIDSIYYITRNYIDFKTCKMDKTTFVDEMVKILRNEFNNLQNFWTILDACTDTKEDKFMDKVKDCINKCLEKNEIVNINIPFFDDKREFETKIKDMLIDTIGKRGDNNDY